MVRTRITTLAAAVGVAGLVAALGAAHERRAAGRYQLVVGFGTEPAYAGERNSVQVRITDAAGKPVVDAGDGLEVEITHGAAPSPAAGAGSAGRSLGAAIAQGLVEQMNQRAAADPAAGEQLLGDRAGSAPGDGAAGTAEPGAPKLKLALEPNFEVGEFGEPGDYRAWFVPSAAGAYTFRIVGRIGGQRVDQRFASSPGTFDEVADPAAAEFPVKQPTGAQLASRMDREIPRLEVGLALARQHAGRAEAAASRVRLIAAAGATLGALGILSLSLCLTAFRRRG
jgi:hypothetical protein